MIYRVSALVAVCLRVVSLAKLRKPMVVIFLFLKYYLYVRPYNHASRRIMKLVLTVHGGINEEIDLQVAKIGLYINRE